MSDQAPDLRDRLVAAIAREVCRRDEDPTLELDWGSTDALASVAADAVLADLGLEHVGWHMPETKSPHGPNVHDFQWHDGWVRQGSMHATCVPVYRLAGSP